MAFGTVLEARLISGRSSAVGRREVRMNVRVAAGVRHNRTAASQLGMDLRKLSKEQ